MSAKLHLDPKELAALITASAREVLDSHRFVIAKPASDAAGPAVLVLTDDERDDLLFELGRNTAGAAFAIDSNPANGE